ncbi:hypothetical protein AMECASPLE_033421, partial [Ameca splendens]
VEVLGIGGIVLQDFYWRENRKRMVVLSKRGAEYGGNSKRISGKLLPQQATPSKKVFRNNPCTQDLSLLKSISSPGVLRGKRWSW